MAGMRWALTQLLIKGPMVDAGDPAAKGTTTSLTTKQKLALRRKLKYNLYYFLTFVAVLSESLTFGTQPCLSRSA